MTKALALTIKQEAFCQKYILNGGNATQAYKDTYDFNGKQSTAARKAKELIDNGKITARINELRQDRTNEFLYTKEQCFEEYAKEQEAAHNDKQYSAAISAINGKAKLFGLHEDKLTLKTDRDQFEEMLKVEMNKIKEEN